MKNWKQCLQNPLVRAVVLGLVCAGLVITGLAANRLTHDINRALDETIAGLPVPFL
jgi:hypothetical protein